MFKKNNLISVIFFNNILMLLLPVLVVSLVIYASVPGGIIESHVGCILPSLLRNIAAALILIFVVSVVISLNTARKITTFIKRLRKQTEAISSGNYIVDGDIQKYSEFEELASDFNAMAEYISNSNKTLRTVAYIDSVTGLANKLYLMEEIVATICSCANGGAKFALLYIDLDDFKKMNDTFGHNFGDKIIRAVGETLAFESAGWARVFRLGGDEFAILVDRIGAGLEVDVLFEKLMRSFDNAINVENKSVFVDLSMGVAFYPDDASSVDELFKFADIAMYAAKNAGKNNYRKFDVKMRNAIERRHEIESNLHMALSKNELELNYQPMHDVDNGGIAGFEALIRWNSSELGRVSPIEFIDVAEDSGMIVDIGNWIIRTACETIMSINRAYGSSFRISINISAIQLLRDSNVEKMISILHDTGIDKSLVDFEITESVLIESFDEVVTSLQAIKASGVSVSLDDFGTGYSSFSYIYKLPIDTIKIDRAFIVDSETNGDSRSLLESIIGMAHKLGMSTVAEGVENEEQLGFVTAFGCDVVQGYYFSEPLDCVALEKYVAESIREEEIMVSEELVSWQ